MNQRRTWQQVARRIRVPLGFVFAAVFLWLARPTPLLMAWSLLLVVPGVWLRGFASGYVRKNTELTTTGPYAYTRNPLYLGSMMIAFGFAAASGNLIILMVLSLLFIVIYLPTIRSEEVYLHRRFPGFAAYAGRVPRLLPRLTPFAAHAPRGRFSAALYRQHREYNCGVGVIALYAALAIRWIFFPH